MATSAVSIRDKVDEVVLQRLNNDAINRYTLADGQTIQKEGLDALMKVRDRYAAAAFEEENGTSLKRFAFFRD